MILRDIINGKHDYIDWILEKLRLIQTGLAVEFEISSDIIVMTISADGVEENFNIVADLIIKAPQINQWKFIAFRQPVAKDKVDKISVSVNGLSLKANMFKFLPLTDNGFLYVQIFSDLLTKENQNDIEYACLLMVDNIVGEYDCVTKVKGYEFYNLSEASDYVEELRPLSEIQEFLNDFYEIEE